jgi:hypothetical protein
MTIPSILDWIEITSLSAANREGGLPYPIIGGLHLLSIALFGGMLLITDLRLLGWALSSRKVSDIWYLALPWKRLGFLVVVVMGLLLMWAEPIRLYRSPAFWVKMMLFALVGVRALVFSPQRLQPARKTRCRNHVAGKTGSSSIPGALVWDRRRRPAYCV